MVDFFLRVDRGVPIAISIAEDRAGTAQSTFTTV
jgi:hypothetical protein